MFVFRYPMEMHIVHRKQSYGSVQEALNHSDGLSVLAFFFQVSKVLLLANSLICSHSATLSCKWQSRLHPYGAWCRVVWYMCIDVSEVPSASGWIIIYIENTGSRSFGKSVTQSTEYKESRFIRIHSYSGWNLKFREHRRILEYWNFTSAWKMQKKSVNTSIS